MPEQDASVQSVTSGTYLRKQTVLRTWAKRWVRLDGDVLIYRPDAQSEKDERHLALGNFHIVNYPKKAFAFSLLPVNGKDRKNWACGSEAEKVAWWTAIFAVSAASSVSNAPPPERNEKNDYEKVALIGAGTSGKVYKVLERQTGRCFALKVMHMDTVVDQHMEGAVLRESVLLRGIDHPFVVKLHRAFRSHGSLCLVLTFAPGGSLLHHRRHWGYLTEQTTRFYGAEIALALDHLHSLNIVHRDLKLGNVLLGADGHALLTDFGFATSKPNPNTFCGTPSCMAPEIVRHEPYTKAVDWWSFGSVLYEMLMGSSPFASRSKEETYRKILTEPVVFHRAISDEVSLLIAHLLNKDGNHRWGFSQVRASAFFGCTDWLVVMNKSDIPPLLPHLADERKNFDNHGGAARQAEQELLDTEFTQQGLFEGFSFKGVGQAATVT
eukprot:NODE_1244_length_1620_cov_25.314449_g1109_i0.p1 GENE.NODE_1244_length_1620_cov_25.314449_g1109_i0~~NODE_1244_length_1620_cov_25.314449_g1109_i0.p1  ORF type:complete len:438 (+),score=69.86 NODE_1244_length_1620_cov_25.314449_g1109_i0:128-1441(+)